PSVRNAGLWTAFLAVVAFAFAGLLTVWLGPEKGLEFVTGYLIEWSLAVDNIFVFVMVFAAMRIPAHMQYRVLFWGVIGALVMRGGMIIGGAALVKQFHWILYVFGGFLLLTGLKMLTTKDDHEADPESVKSNPAVRLAQRYLRFTDKFDGQKFFTIENGRRVATPLFLTLIFIEFSDLIFAVDSIPAIFAITTDPFIVFTSNVLAILGLRSMYFLLAGIIDRFVYLKTGLSLVLVFIGIKMLLLDIYKIPTAVSLLVVVGILGTSVAASLVSTRRTHVMHPPVKPDPAGDTVEAHD
ncbi:MAG TPA: TerC family protein, partial [Deinococcales bacterium]|nr:TerC family protein [Deinococcales bacterium]